MTRLDREAYVGRAHHVLYFSYAYRSLRARTRTNALTLLAVALFVTGSTFGLSFYRSLKRSFVDSAPLENIVVLAKGAPTEQSSRLDLETARKVVFTDGVAKSGDAPLAARELVSRGFLDGSTGKANDVVPLRGIDDSSLEVHRATLVAGTLPRPGSMDVILGKRVAASRPKLVIGTELDLPGGPSKVTGIFSAGNSPYEDEVWMPRTALELHLKLRVTSSVTLVADSPVRVRDIIDKISDDKALVGQAYSLRELRNRDFSLAAVTRLVLVLLVLLSAVGGFAMATTMNAATATRMPEFAALAAIGVRRESLSRMVLFEAFLLAVIGSVIGLVISIFVSARFGNITVGTNPLQISASPVELLIGLGLGVTVGVLGAVVPSRAVRRLDILAAMR